MMRRAALLSLGLHGLILVALMFRLVPSGPPPPVYAEVELIQQPTPTVGDGPRESGQGQADAATAPPPVAPAPPPTAPTEAEVPPVPMPPAPVQSGPPEPAPPAPRQSPVRSQPPRQAMATPPPPAPAPSPPRQQTASPPTPPPPPPSPPTEAPVGPPADPPAIRLGEGGPAGTGLVSGDNIIPAAPDSKVRNLPPAYPPEAARMGEEGTVILVVHVAPDGSALGIDVQETSGFERLDRAARDAVARWHFRPAQQFGVPVASDMPVRIRFVLKE